MACALRSTHAWATIQLRWANSHAMAAAVPLGLLQYVPSANLY
jgi:hypothetical protein